MDSIKVFGKVYLRALGGAETDRLREIFDVHIENYGKFTDKIQSGRYNGNSLTGHVSRTVVKNTEDNRIVKETKNYG